MGRFTKTLLEALCLILAFATDGVRTLSPISCKTTANGNKRPVEEGNLPTEIQLEDTDGLRRPPLLRGATQSIGDLSMR